MGLWVLIQVQPPSLSLPYTPVHSAVSMGHISSDLLLVPSLQGSHTEGHFVERVGSSYSGCKDEPPLLLAESMRVYGSQETGLVDRQGQHGRTC